jgi:hypothetical protein
MRALALGAVLLLLASVLGTTGPAARAADKVMKKKFVYRSHTQIDLSGQTVEGKTRAPEVFYVFQRKRTESHHVVHTPGSFDYHRDVASDALKRALPR